MRRCPRCETDKPAGEFYHRAGKPGGLCKPCTVARVAEWRTANPEKWRQRSAAQDAARKRNAPEKVAAKIAVMNALQQGKLTRPPCCERCKKPCKPHGHHPNYAEPLRVLWLCPDCHRAVHRKEQ